MMPWHREAQAKEAMADGKGAHRQGKPVTTNPHVRGSRPWSFWNAGWRFDEAFSGNGSGTQKEKSDDAR